MAAFDEACCRLCLKENKKTNHETVQNKLGLNAIEEVFGVKVEFDLFLSENKVSPKFLYFYSSGVIRSKLPLKKYVNYVKEL